MKAFVSVDLEGMPHVVIPGHLNLKGSLYNEARGIATKVTIAVADELNKNGFTEVVVADSHGPMVNLLVDDLPEYIELIRGTPRPVSMVSGIEGCSVAVFLGYHAKFGTIRSTWDHSQHGFRNRRMQCRGVPWVSREVRNDKIYVGSYLRWTKHQQSGSERSRGK